MKMQYSLAHNYIFLLILQKINHYNFPSMQQLQCCFLHSKKFQNLLDKYSIRTKKCISPLLASEVGKVAAEAAEAKKSQGDRVVVRSFLAIGSV